MAQVFVGADKAQMCMMPFVEEAVAERTEAMALVHEAQLEFHKHKVGMLQAQIQVLKKEFTHMQMQQDKNCTTIPMAEGKIQKNDVKTGTGSVCATSSRRTAVAVKVFADMGCGSEMLGVRLPHSFD